MSDAEIKTNLISTLLSYGDDRLVNLIKKDLTINELKELVESRHYKQRREDGLFYSDLLGGKIVVSSVNTDIKGIISLYLQEAQGYLAMGWWISATKNLIAKEIPNEMPQEMYDDIIVYMRGYVLDSYGITL